ncbi:hypothetical protein K1X84_01950 [bacterium]|nr:hypothetical protein [bacterium]
MEQRHREYTDYYEARMNRYLNIPMYQNSYEAEKALFQAISEVEKLEDFRAVLEKNQLNIRVAIAKVKDTEKARLEFYDQIHETVRAKSSERILQAIDNIQSPEELTRMVLDIETENNLFITVDLFADCFYSDFKILEEIEVAESIVGDIPQEWRQEESDRVHMLRKSGRTDYEQRIVPGYRQYQPDWKINYALIGEKRHRRKIPFPEEVVQKRIKQHQRYTGME